MSDDRGTGDGTGTKYQPRQEARVLKFGELTEQQRRAAIEVHALLRGYLEQKYAPLKPAKGLQRIVPHIEESRRNQNLLLDGDRGSGKTSLLVTMLQLWSLLLGGEGDTREGNEKEKDAQKADTEEKKRAWGVEVARWPVVPLSIVDLQPLPGHTPVLLHLAEPLVRVLEAIEDQENPEEPAPAWLGAEQQGLKSRKAWDELVRTIVAGWDDAASERWGRLEPESAEFEINRAVRGHQAVVSSFHRFVDQLIEDFKRCRYLAGKTPLFVLSVDDADMNPDRAEELLEALRMLNHPRLVFLLTGDSELFYRIAEERVARKLRSPRGRTQEDEISPVRDRLATTLARRVYDKILPPSHRCALPLLGEDQRADHLQKVAALDVKSHRHPTHAIPIAQILKEPSARAGLPGHLRVLKDLELLVEREGVAPSVALSRVVLRIWAEAIEDAPTDVYLPSLLTPRVRVPSDGRPLVVEALDGNLKTRDEGAWDGTAAERRHGAHSLTLMMRSAWSIRVTDSKTNKEIPRQLVSALMLADMIAFEHGVPRNAEDTPLSDGHAPRFAQVLYQVPGTPDPHLFGWPLPNGLTLLDASIVSLRWGQAVRSINNDHPTDVDAMARWFLAVVAQLVTMYEGGFAPLPLAPTEKAQEPGWREVARRVLHLARRNGALSPREVYLRDWAIGRAVLLAAPESGLSSESATALLLAFEEQATEDLCARVRDASRVQRGERLRAALKGAGSSTPGDAQVDELRKLIDDQNRDHPWLTFLSRRLTATAPRAVESAPAEPTTATSAAVSKSAPVGLEPLVTAVDDSTAVRERFLVAMGNLAMIQLSADEKEAVQKLPASDTPLLREFTSALDDLRGMSGQRPYAFKHLLETAARRAGFPDLWGHFNTTGSRIEFEPLPGRYEASSMPSRLPKLHGSASGLEFRDCPRYVVTSPDGRELTPLLDFIYRCAWDARVLENNSTTGGTPFAGDWNDSVSAPLDAKSRVLWPSPPWRTFAQARAFASSWKALLDTASAPRAIPIPSADLEAALAFQYLYHTNTFRNPLPRGQAFSFALDFHAGSLFTTIMQSAAPADSSLLRESLKPRVIQWLRGLALLLAPESNLPVPLIAAVRSGIDITSSPARGAPSKDAFWLSRDDVKPLRDLRVDRVMLNVSGTTAGRRLSAKKLLEELDAQGPSPHWNDLLKSLESIDPPAS